MLLAYLSWITDENAARRIDRAKASIDSLKHIVLPVNSKVLVINNGGNDWIENEIRYTGFDYIKLPKNYLDVSVHMTGHSYAQMDGHELFCYTYDDYVLTDREFVSPCEQFMSEHEFVDCIRVARYDVNNQKRYDKEKTSKSVNPESVCHENSACNTKLTFIGPKSYGERNFFISNWRPNSRPMIWRTHSFNRFSCYEENCIVMQPFEKRMYDICDEQFKKGSYMSGFMDIGAFKTFPQETSDRTRLPNACGDIRVNTKELRDYVFAHA